VTQKLPQGLQTMLGEGGGLLSGGEGQRVRLARALLSPGTRLALLDEPFRGMDRTQRRALLAEARKWWAGVTLLCVTHDVAETMSFDRVLVVEGGRIIEDGDPRVLAASASRYRDLLEAEKAVGETLWEGAFWRRLTLSEGRLEAGEPA
jgi:ABC-type transport system involved in cytochrome bd biosynthesis fused ATPase/permease subunit